MRDKWYRNSPPPECEKYLITDDCGNLQVAYWTDNSPITGEPSNVWRWIGLIQYTHVIAWRPLPEPYSEPVNHGRWELITQNKFTGTKTLRCTYCKNYFVVRDDTLNAGRGDANFCPNCGSKNRMDGDSE